MTSAAAYDVHAALLAHLRAALGQVFDGKVVDPALDDAGRVQPYWVLWFAPGSDPDRALTRTPDAAAHGFQISAAGMDAGRALWAADAATTVLDGLYLTAAATAAHEAVEVAVRWPDGFTAPPAREDRDVDPPRWFVPLQFVAAAV